MCSEPEATCTTKLQAFAERGRDTQREKKRDRTTLRKLYAHNLRTSCKAQLFVPFEATAIHAPLKHTAYASNDSRGDSRSYIALIPNDGIVTRREKKPGLTAPANASSSSEWSTKSQSTSARNKRTSSVDTSISYNNKTFVHDDSHSADLPEKLRDRVAAARQHRVKVAFRLGKENGHCTRLGVVNGYRGDYVGMGRRA